MVDEVGLNAKLTAEAQDFIRDLDKLIDKSIQFGQAMGLTQKQVQQFDKQLNQVRSGVAGLANEENKATNAVKAHTQAQGAQESSLIRTRYALYDVATTYAIVSAAALGSAGAVANAAIQYESAFSAVQRTTLQDSGEIANNINSIKDELLDLSTVIPVAFTDLTQIAALGAQLGVASTDLDKFTETVAKFSATTNVSVEETAKSFGSIGQLLDVPIDQYNNLGSAIALVGVNSVATESEILSVTNGIAAAASGIGLTAQETVGFAGALSSLRIPTYLSSGFATRFFSDLSIAVATGGDELTKFSSLLGISNEEAQRLFNTDPSQFLVSLLTALNRSDNLAVSLQNLGVTSSNDQRVLSKLAQNVDVLTKALSDSNKGFDEGTFLNDAYAQVVEDVASQLQILLNTFNNFLSTAGGPFLAFLGAAVPQLTEMLKGFTEFAKSGPGQVFFAIIGPATIVVGLFAAYRSALALATASVYALRTAQASLGGGSLTIRGLTAEMLGLSVAGNTAAGSITRGAAALKLFKSALVTTGIGALVVGLSELAFNFDDISDHVDDFASGVAGARTPVIELAGNVFSLGDAILGTISPLLFFANVLGGTFAKAGRGFGSAGSAAATTADRMATSLASAGAAAGGAAKQVRLLTDYSSDLAGVFRRATDLRFASQLNVDEAADSWADLTQRIRDAQAELLRLTADKQIKEYFLTVANSFGDTLRAGELQADIAELNNQISSAQDSASTGLTGTTGAARKNRKAITDLLVDYQNYIAALASGGASQDTLNAAVAQSRADFIAQAQALGFSNAELQPYIASFNDLTYAINNVPRNVSVNANVNPAVTAIQEFLAKLNSGGYGSGSVPLALDQAAAENAGSNAAKGFIKGFGKSIGKGAGGGGGGGGGGALVIDFRGPSGWESGGYTGAGPSNKPAGVVHKGEYVIPKPYVNQSTGLPYADAFGAMSRGTRSSGPGYSTGGYVGSASAIVELGPKSLQAVRAGAARDVLAVLAASPQQLAAYTAQGNSQSQARGSN